MIQRIALSLLLACGSTVAVAATVTPTCMGAIKAMEKALVTDHATATQMGDRISHGITVGGVTYIEVRGKWTASKMSAQEMVQMSQENLRNAKTYTCQALPDSVVDGTPVTNMKAHSEAEDSKTDSLISFARSSGLPVRVENTIVSDGDTRHYVTTYSYTGIRAPEVK